MDIGTAILGSSAVFSGLIGGTVALLKLKKSDNKTAPEECPDADCKGLLIQTATIADRNTKDIAEINKTIKRDVLPGISYMTGKIDEAIKTEKTKMDETGHFIRSQIKDILDDVINGKT